MVCAYRAGQRTLKGMTIARCEKPLARIVSGGQTGVDRAALDVASELSLPCGGWCPAGRRAEDGCIDARYPLQETPTDQYTQRTEWNVRDSDATLIIADGALTGGTLFTKRCAKRLDKPLWICDPADTVEPAKFRMWLRDHRIETLNVAGPRESHRPGIHARAKMMLGKLLADPEQRGE